MAEAAAAVSRLYGVSVEPRPAPTAAELNLRPTRISAPAPGFGSRQTLISLIDPAKISTLVTWDSNEIYDAWRASPERGRSNGRRGRAVGQAAGVGALRRDRLARAVTPDSSLSFKIADPRAW